MNLNKLRKSHKIYAEGWHSPIESADKRIYRVQIEFKDLRSRKRILKFFNNKEPVVEAYASKRSEVNFFTFLKEFENIKEWSKWASSFPFPMIETSVRSGRVKRFGTLKRGRGRPSKFKKG